MMAQVLSAAEGINLSLPVSVVLFSTPAVRPLVLTEGSSSS